MSVRKRGATWYLDICEKGKPRIQRALNGATTKAQALKAEAVIRTQLFEKRYGLTERPEVSFRVFTRETFLPYSKLNKKSYRSDVSICKALEAFFGEYNLADIDRSMIEKYKQQRVSEETRLKKLRSPCRVNKELQTLSKLLTLALEAELIRSKPKIRLFQVSNERIRYLTADEEARLLEALEGCPWLCNIVVMALHTGMRRGELTNLKWFDVDFERRVLNVRNTKNGRDRFVPINSTVLQLLERLPKTSSFVFPSPRIWREAGRVQGPIRDRAEEGSARRFQIPRPAAYGSNAYGRGWS
jgi:integrase